ncbi:MAG: heavy-metal-associated domain-containing protein [Candidatus Marinimicrobia bacterium]|jgi:copper chaperone CopZ|nr:heavy-metal-associated domain-containing protein [Candidatus Neomarinimicrobiota bacterium]|tara:strand:- start:237 stop:458 length:222 start_codon:yes stop_codon:yes gene_type:complete
MADIIFQINDIHCEKCVEKIRQALENLGGLEEVHFDLDEKIVRIEGEADPIAIEQIIQDTGYTAVQLQGGDKH